MQHQIVRPYFKATCNFYHFFALRYAISVITSVIANLGIGDEFTHNRGIEDPSFDDI